METEKVRAEHQAIYQILTFSSENGELQHSLCSLAGLESTLRKAVSLTHGPFGCPLLLLLSVLALHRLLLLVNLFPFLFIFSRQGPRYQRLVLNIRQDGLEHLILLPIFQVLG